MKDQLFPGKQDPMAQSDTEDWRLSGSTLTINSQTEFHIEGTILIGMWTHGDYRNIVLDEATGLRFAKAIQNHFAGLRFAREARPGLEIRK